LIIKFGGIESGMQFIDVADRLAGFLQLAAGKQIIICSKYGSASVRTQCPDARACTPFHVPLCYPCPELCSCLAADQQLQQASVAGFHCNMSDT
jgi:hypothetical protein